LLIGTSNRKLNLQLSTYAVASFNYHPLLKLKFLDTQRLRGGRAFSGLPFGGQNYVIATA
jgi:hypothetical protein